MRTNKCKFTGLNLFECWCIDCKEFTDLYEKIVKDTKVVKPDNVQKHEGKDRDMTREEKITKVVLEYKTYRTILRGKDAENWLFKCNAAAFMSTVHGAPLPEFPWKTEKITSQKHEGEE
jgi:hypothetical protein